VEELARSSNAIAQTLVLGTRGSPLARRQTDLIVTFLRQRFPTISLAVRTVSTEGDRVQDRPISELGDKGVFVRSIEQALVAGDIDLAVHSLKDLPSDVETPGLVIAAFSPREDPRDAFLSRDGVSLHNLASGAVVGTSSLRRRVQLLAMRPDLQVADIRGNVGTRLRKLAEGRYEALILAAAGLKRLGLEHHVVQYLPVEDFVPDAGQGILAVQGREGDPATQLVRMIDDGTSRVVARAERAVARALDAGCRSPVGAYATVESDTIHVLGMAATEDGSRLVRAQRQGAIGDAEATGLALGRDLLRHRTS